MQAKATLKDQARASWLPAASIRALKEALHAPGESVLASCPQGLDALALSTLAQQAAQDGRIVVHIAPSDADMARMHESLRFFAPGLPVVRFPAWDCAPYDRVSPSARIIAERMASLAAIARHRQRTESTPDKGASPFIVLTTAAAALQRCPPREMVRTASIPLKPGQTHRMEDLADWLIAQGFTRVGTVTEPGEFAMRGALLDIYTPGWQQPVRLDFFGDELESIRAFDVRTQRTTRTLPEIILEAASEVPLDEAARDRFRRSYVETFGGEAMRDPIVEAIREGRRYQGMEHWLPLFHERLESLFDHVGEKAVVAIDHESTAALTSRREEIAEYHAARTSGLKEKLFGADPYRPLPPEALHLTEEEWQETLSRHAVFLISPFAEDPSAARPVIDLKGRKGRSFAAEREAEGVNVFEAVRDHVATLRKSGRKVLLAAFSPGSAERLSAILSDHGLAPLGHAQTFNEALAQGERVVSTAVLGLDSGFETESLAVVSEQDILGDRLVRRTRPRRREADVITELTALSPGDLVVHVDHGIGRFEGLKTIDVGGAPHDCLHLTYAGGDRLFLPVENIDLLSRYGGEEATAQLDKLGGAAWQARKARLKKRLKEIAEELIRIAAARQLLQAPVITPPEGLMEEFCARFPYEETEDQKRAIEAVLEDLASGRPMDRLICGDVGFGKTEVALRAAFATVMSGHQVALIVPTTLLARQHAATFRERFAGFPVNIAVASRMTPRRELANIKKGLADGTIDIVIGTHALLARDVRFADLALLIVDEEQHFGVKHKERLKALKESVHVLTLTATPIPRTLQLALSGVRELSVIATPPADRLAVRTFLTPFDPVSIREALLREHYRGGQSFYVVPRISDLEEIAAFLREHVPEVRFATAHGRMTPKELDEVMTAFYERRFDVLLATTIIESGLDIPSANTMIVHRADMFGLAQLYQLRGRVGRSRLRAWCLLTIPPNRQLTPAARKRLEVLQSLDSLGAGFQLASHDLDIRGAGNLLGEEQSGHIREVGFELYQHMLEEAVAALKSGVAEEEAEETFSPAINLGVAVLIPESYVPDLGVRMGLYRRLSRLDTQEEIDAFAAELHDRFGPLPEEVRHLLEVVAIKGLCRAAHVAAVDAGIKGAVLRFHHDTFPAPQALVEWIADQGTRAKLRPDMRLVVKRDWQDLNTRMKGIRRVLTELGRLAEKAL
ncbi:transcription-repair coupling factor [Thermopetrobacter sp. TC1]|uniref:transcription-repair coupling factor n=1 Tax=Thermopetrobacter sp. TC1 TaxID=1495045 RepID=UPI0009DD9E92|nr:transcription-repair coupling factor [Thermopetrobacter sp. TC1]